VKVWLTPLAAEDFAYWQDCDPAAACKLAQTLQQLAQRDSFSLHQITRLALRFPQLLSVRISPEHRVVFERLADDIIVHQCRYHY
jgi:toxin YoeB